MKLKELKRGESGRVIGYECPDRMYRQKLLQMGLVKGAEFTLIRVAPMGDPVEIQLSGFNLTLRKVEGDALTVERINP